MAFIRVKNGGNDANGGTDWTTDALATLGQAFTNWTSGDVILVLQNSDVGGGTASLTLTGGTTPDIIPVYSSDTSDNYAVSSISTPNINLTTAGADLVLGGGIQLHGIAIVVNDNITTNDGSKIILTDGTLKTLTAGSVITLGGSGGDSVYKSLNTDIDLSVDGYIKIALTSIEMIGGSIAGTVTLGGLLRPGSLGRSSQPCRLYGVNMGSLTATSNYLVDASAYSGGDIFDIEFINCITPTGVMVVDSGMSDDEQIIRLTQSGTSDAEIGKVEKHAYRAVLTTSIGASATWLTGGYSVNDGSGTTKNISHEITPNSGFKDGSRFEGPWLHGPNTTTGTSQTVTIYSADNFTTAPNKNQAFIEVVTMSTTGEVLGTLATSRPTDLLATTAMTSDSSDWNDTAAGAPSHKHKMEVSFTAQVEGLIAVRVVLEGQDLSGETANSFFYDPEVNVA